MPFIATKFQTSLQYPFIASTFQSKVERNTHTISLDGGRIARVGVASTRGVNPNNLKKRNQDTYYMKNSRLSAGKQSNIFICGVCDGHGEKGEQVSKFISKKLPRTTMKELKKFREPLTEGAVEKACFDAHAKCSRSLDVTPFISSRTSGSTSVSVYFWDDNVTVCNVGDSRAVAGEFLSDREKVVAKALSRDQTAFRQDERDRVISCGARVLNHGQAQGHAETHENWNDEHVGVHLEKIHDDAPRVWDRDNLFPGCQFTRSFGDFAVEDLGIHSQPEIVTLKISASERYLVLASDGVWEFLTNQDVIDICCRFSNPKDACDAIVELSSKLWLQNSKVTDDTTIICVYLNDAQSNNSQPNLLDISAKRNISTEYSDDTSSDCS